MLSLLGLLLSGCRGEHSALDPRGVQAAHIARLYTLFFIVCVIVWVLVAVVTVWGVWRKRQHSTDAAADTPLVTPDPTRERKLGFWVNVCVTLTTIILFGLLFADFTTGRAIHEFSSKPNAVNIVVTGHQWWWEVRYDDESADKVFTTNNEIHVPLGRPVKVVLQTGDVIHSFWVPNLTGKKDMIPNHSSELWFQADKAGMYWGQCAEFCGYQHAKMRLLVIAEEQSTFDAWAEASRAPARPPITDETRHGQQVFISRQCSMCHSIVGTSAGGRVGPDLTHMMGHYTFAAGAIPNTPGHLAAWILDPQKFKPGCRMSQNTLPTKDFRDLLEYLRTLQ